MGTGRNYSLLEPEYLYQSAAFSGGILAGYPFHTDVPSYRTVSTQEKTSMGNDLGARLWRTSLFSSAHPPYHRHCYGNVYAFFPQASHIFDHLRRHYDSYRRPA